MRAAGVSEEFFYHVGRKRLVRTFVPRSTIHKAILEGIATDIQSTGTMQHICMIHGLGGAGKSQIALHYIKKTRAEYSGIFWIDAGNLDSIKASFEHLFSLLYPDRIPNKEDPSRLEKLAQEIGDWFSTRKERFLLVFDGADSIENPGDSSYIDLDGLVPHCVSVNVIVTTRIAGGKGWGSCSVEVGEMNEKEASQLLLNSSGLGRRDLTQGEVEEIKKIAQELEYFALAIQLAGSYISQTPRISSHLSEYLLEYRKRRKQLLGMTPKPHDRYTTSVLGTWEVSFEAVRGKSIMAENLLTFLTFINFKNIDTSMFEEYINNIEELDGIGSDPEGKCFGHWKTAIDPRGTFRYHDLEAAFTILENFSFIRQLPDRAEYSMHRLVHAWGHDRLEQEKRLQMNRAAAVFIGTHIWMEPAFRGSDSQLVTHVMAHLEVMASTEPRGHFDDMTFRYLSKVYGPFLRNHGSWFNRYRLKTCILDYKSRHLGEKNLETLAAKNDVIDTLIARGMFKTATAMGKEIVEVISQVHSLGGTLPLAATRRLATALRKLEEFDKAAVIQKEVVEKLTQLHGQDYDVTIEAKIEYIGTLRGQLKFPEALKATMEVWKLLRLRLGGHNHYTISMQEIPASIYEDLGLLDEAGSVRRSVLGLRIETALRATPGTEECFDAMAASSNSQCFLAHWFIKSGEHQKAEEGLIITLGAQKMLHGIEHSNTTSTLCLLAKALFLQGKFAETEAVIKDTIRETGTESVSTLIAKKTLFYALYQQGKFDEALELSTKLEETCTEFYGAHGHRTLRVFDRFRKRLHWQDESL